MSYHLVRKNPDVNTTTGHHTVEVYVEERLEDGSGSGINTVNRGVMEKYGISTMELKQKYDGDIEKWLARVGQEMVAKYKERAGVQMDLLKVHGTDILIPE